MTTTTDPLGGTAGVSRSAHVHDGAHALLVEVLAQPVEESAQHARVGDVVVVVDAVGRVAEPVQRVDQRLLHRRQRGQRVRVTGPPLAARHVLEVAGVQHETGPGEHVAQELQDLRQPVRRPVDLLEAEHAGVGAGRSTVSRSSRRMFRRAAASG